MLAEYPEIGVHGFQVFPPLRPGADFVEQVETAYAWFADAPLRRRLLIQHGSYRVKHLVERSARTYVSNGAAIVAAVLAGFEPVRSRPGPNCRFKLR
ncbi:hypothetical protein LJR175_004392 [Variovorax sp. LjRoot175]|uniref:hypothetical protein n=1 Tax=Variovorax sp. LjRoot175 TaxID=3342276 RepID=UPI003ED1741D